MKKLPNCVFCEIREQEEGCCYCTECRTNKSITENVLEIWERKNKEKSNEIKQSIPR